ncbi:MAG: hypothetical protein ACLP5H_34100 [Desulfomonilaceae bacterium]
MKRGNERLELLRSGIGMPRERIVGPIAGKKISRDDPQMSFFTQGIASGSHVQENTAPVSTVETDELQGERCEIEASGKVTHVSSGVLANYKIPKLINKKVRAGGSVPKILVLRSRSAAIVEEPEPVQPPLPGPLTVLEEQERPVPSARPAPIEALPHKHVVTVVPTPRKQRARRPKLDVDAVASAPTPKPLKVIRRRRVETPKFFETTAKAFPRAMLEGIDIELGENNHGQID